MRDSSVLSAFDELLVARDRPAPVHHQERHQLARLPPPELALDAVALDPHHERSAHLDPGVGERAHRAPAEVVCIALPVSSRRTPMAKVVNCECGLIIRGKDDEELFEQVESHISDHHPDLVGTITREDLLSMAEEE
jgi:predicted small metal-binding protein